MSVTSAPAFSAWLDDFLTAYYRLRPVNATFIGVHEFDEALPDLSEAGTAATLDNADGLLARLHSLPPEELSAAEALDRQLAEGFLLIQRWESSSAHFGWGNPSVATGEAVFGVLGLLLQGRRDAAKARLAGLPALLQAAEQHVRAAPRAWVERARRECTGGRLLMGQLDLPGGVGSGRGVRALRRLARARAAATGRRRLTRVATKRLPAAAARTLSGAEHRRAGAIGAGAHGRAGGGAGAVARPADQGAPVHDDYLGRFAEVWHDVREAAQERDLLTFPEWPVRYVDQPEWVRAAAPYLYFLPYRSPPPLDPPPVVDYFAPLGADEATIKLNHVVHHGSIGHHVQNWHAARAESRIGRIAAVDCAARIAMLCGGTLAEGWACYSTDLAESWAS